MASEGPRIRCGSQSSRPQPPAPAPALCGDLGLGYPRRWAGWEAIAMNEVEPDSPVRDVVRRALNLLLHPAETWDAIEAEPDTIERLFRHWVLPLAAIPAIGRMLSQLSFGHFDIFGFRFYQPNVVAVFGDAPASYALTLISVYLLALVVDHFALQFGGERSRIPGIQAGGGLFGDGGLAVRGLPDPAGRGRPHRHPRHDLQSLPALPRPAEADALGAGLHAELLRPDPGGGDRDGRGHQQRDQPRRRLRYDPHLQASARTLRPGRPVRPGG